MMFSSMRWVSSRGMVISLTCVALAGLVAIQAPVAQPVPPDDAPAELFGDEASGSAPLAARSAAAPSVAAPPPGLPVLGGTWIAAGPQFADDGQVENIGIDDEVIGAIHTVIAHPVSPGTLWIGATNGGIWRTDNATASSPTWTPQTDSDVSLSIGAMDLDPTDATNNTLVAGIGTYSSFGLTGGPLTPGLLRTIDGGATWTAIDDPLLSTESCSGISAVGSTILFAANEFAGFGGLNRSTNTGATWSIIDGAGGTGLPTEDVHDLVRDPTDGSNLRHYLTSDNNGVYRSTDGGATWTLISDATQTTVFAAGSNNNAELAVAPTTGRLYCSIILSGQVEYVGYTDNPTAVTPTWTRMDLPTIPATLGASLTVTAASFASPINIIVSIPHGLSTGQFVEVAGVTGNTAANGIHRITVTTGTSFDLNLSTGNGAYAGGGTVTELDGVNPRDKPGSQGGIHASILVDEVSAEIVYLGGDRQDSPFPNLIGAVDFSGNLWRGDTTIAAAGTSPSPQWDHLTHDTGVGSIPGGGTTSGSSPHADSREMAFDANGNIIEVDDGGIYRRTSPRTNTGDWVSVNGDLQVTEMHDVTYDTVANIIMSGNQDTGTMEQMSSGSTSWTSVSTADGGDVAVEDIGATSFRYSSFQVLGSFRRREHNTANTLLGTVFPPLTGGIGSFSPSFVSPVETNASSSMRLVIGGTNGILESTDRGATSTFLGTAGINDDCLAYGTPASPDVLYAGAGTDVLVRLSGAGAPVSTSTPFPGGFITDLAINPSDGNQCFVTGLGGAGFLVYETPDAGVTWNNVTGSLTDTNVRSIVFMPGPPADVIVVGTGHGVFFSDLAGLGTWSQLGSGMPNAPVYDLDYDAADDVLVAGTLGRGAWILNNAAIPVELSVFDTD